MTGMWRIGAAAAFLAFAAQVGAEQAHRIGFISMQSPGPTSDPLINAFKHGLKELGYIDGKNVVIEVRYANGNPDRLPEIIADLLRLKADVLMAGSTISVLAAKNATKTTPIVFAYVSDPVSTGIAASLAHPGGNVTGTTFGTDVGAAGKWLELLKEAVPQVSHFAVLTNRANPASASFVRELEAAALALKVRLDIADAENDPSLERAFAAIGLSGAGAMVVGGDPLFTLNRDRIVRFAANKRLPAMYFSKLLVNAGGLMSYGVSQEDSYRRAAAYVDKILKGAKPADLPIEQPTRFELAINLKTARALGLRLPPTLLQRADIVVE